MGKVIITKQQNRLLMVLFDEKRPFLMESTVLPEKETLLGNIYLARVQDVVKGIQGAFLAVSEEQMVYLPLSECREILCTNRELKEGESLRQGDEVVIQITSEALKTKQPTASAKLTLTGQYCVCSYFGHGISFSKKLDGEKREVLQSAIGNAELPGRKKYKFTIRTNAGNLQDMTPLLSEMRSFIQIFDGIRDTCRHRTLYSCFYRTEAEIVRRVKNLPLISYEEIVTDEPAVYALLGQAFGESNKKTKKETEAAASVLRLYQDEMLPLSKLYSIETHLKEALGKKVWLPGGGYLVIEPTEAMVVIDVNSGKTESKGKKSKDYFLKINLEAAREIARQLRLRNYSGMIMVDFINMEQEEDKRKLMAALDAYLKEDQVTTRLVDMTALGIVEITRKKVSSPLADHFKKAW